MGKTKRVAGRQLETTPAQRLTEAVVAGMKEKKGKDIVIMNLKDTGSNITDFFVICHGESRTQVDALADSVEEEVRKILGEKPVFSEGQGNSEWILLDYINVVVHIFLKDQRDFYGIERFWADAETIHLA
jgi:ribosome-associated protein